MNDSGENTDLSPSALSDMLLHVERELVRLEHRKDRLLEARLRLLALLGYPSSVSAEER
jgi:hypothetical protein